MLQKKFFCISPYENDSETVAVANLHIKNSLDNINIEGNVCITKDQKGLEYAFALKRQIDTIVDKLKREDLPPVLNSIMT